MPGLGVNVTIIEDGRILLTKRKDFEVWCLPGGSVDDGESIAQAARREAREETGLEVRLERLVGIYSRPHWLHGGLHVVVFTGQGIGGRLTPQPSEVIEMGYFSGENLPEEMLLGHRQRILDSLAGTCGVTRLQDGEWAFPAEMTRQQLYDQMEGSGLKPAEFYLKRVGKPGLLGDVLEVRGIESG
ncbi:MAG: NUDIX domain-containing protein [Anaerolineales bacterium]|nr:NUDIX domain-containing protein [Anaerolineales bacterium]